MEQRILATVYCGGGHRAWDLMFSNNWRSIYFVCSSANSKLDFKTIPLYGQQMLLVNNINRCIIYIFDLLHSI